ncbi:MAG TPA: hypothetical protein PKY72_03585 [Bacilli bacterium]|nr:hypothetical protein [Bacilli bacterium]
MVEKKKTVYEELAEISGEVGGTMEGRPKHTGDTEDINRYDRQPLPYTPPTIDYPFQTWITIPNSLDDIMNNMPMKIIEDLVEDIKLKLNRVLLAMEYTTEYEVEEFDIYNDARLGMVSVEIRTKSGNRYTIKKSIKKSIKE